MREFESVPLHEMEMVYKHATLENYKSTTLCETG